MKETIVFNICLSCRCQLLSKCNTVVNHLNPEIHNKVQWKLNLTTTASQMNDLDLNLTFLCTNYSIFMGNKINFYLEHAKTFKLKVFLRYIFFKNTGKKIFKIKEKKIVHISLSSSPSLPCWAFFANSQLNMPRSALCNHFLGMQ